MQLISLCWWFLVAPKEKKSGPFTTSAGFFFKKYSIRFDHCTNFYSIYVWNQKSRYLVKLTWLNFSSSVHTCMVIIDLTIQSSAKKRPGTGADTIWRPSCWITCFGIEDETAILSRYLYLYYVHTYYLELIYRHLYNFQCTIHR